MQKSFLTGFILFLSFFASPSLSLASTTPLQSEPPANLGFVPTLLPWPDFSGVPNGFTLIASSTQTFNQVTLWTCSNNQIVISRIHVYKGELDNLVEVASSTPISPHIFCPSNLSQRPSLITGDDYRLSYPLQTPVSINTGERLTIFVDSSPYNGGYLLVGAHPTRLASDFITMASTSAATLIPPDPVYPYFPSFELSFDDGCIGACVSNVLFLPGIEASRLYETDPTCVLINCENQLWEPNTDLDAQKLFMATGTSILSDIYTKDSDLVDEVDPLGPADLKFYVALQGDLNRLVASGTIAAWKPIAYDWRQDYDTLLSHGDLSDGKVFYDHLSSRPYILDELFKLASSSKSGKVTIVAHSNGGLLAKALIEKLKEMGRTDLVDNMVLVASPQLGTPQAIGALLNGFDPSSLKLIVYKPTQRTLARDMSMTYNLLPSEGYLNTVTTPVIKFDTDVQPDHEYWGSEINTTNEYTGFLSGLDGRVETNDIEDPGTANQTLLLRALAWHRNFDNWSPPEGVQMTQIAGWGIDTVSGIHYMNDAWFGGFSWAYEPIMTEDGDGTVVTASALEMGGGADRYWLNLENYNKATTTEDELNHANIFESPQLRSFIFNNILTHSTTALPQYFSTTRPLATTITKRLRYFLHSPLSLAVRDNFGNEVSVATSTIPGAYYSEFGEVKYLSVPADIPTTLVMHGEGTGTFTLNMQEVEGGTILATTTFANIPVSTSTLVTMDVPADVMPTSLRGLSIDQNGDGIFEKTVVPGTVITPIVDTTAPEAVITFSTSTNAIVIKGIDESGTTTLSGTTTYPTLKKNQKQYSGIATTTVTIKDATGNTTKLIYTEKLPSPERRDVISLVSISYNGATSSIPATLRYKWNTNQNGAYKLFATYFATSTMVIESHWRPKKDVTVIMQKPIDDDDADTDDDVDVRPVKTKLTGFVIPAITTRQGKMFVNY